MTTDPTLPDQIAARAMEFFDRHDLLGARRGILVAASGGVDSTALVLVLAQLARCHRLPGPLTIGHVDHGVQPRSAEAAAAVAALAERLGLPCQSRRLALGSPVPSEAAMRGARYAALEEMARGCDAGVVCTAHHADDQLETIVFRMTRGTGPRGLAGIPATRTLGGDLQVARPLLEVRRAKLVAMVEACGETWIEDPTNADTTPARNRIRLEVLPLLRDQLGRGFEPSLLALGRAARAVAGAVTDGAERMLAERAHEVTPWRLELDAVPDADQVFLEEALRRIHDRLRPAAPAPWTWVERARDLAAAVAGQRVAGPGELLVERTRSGLLIVDPERAGAPPDGPVDLEPGTIGTRFGATEWQVDTIAHEPSFARPRPSPWRVFVDPRHAPLPWRLRLRRARDRFHPPGLDAPVLLRTFQINRHVPRFDRDRMPLVVDATDAVLWVPGVALRHAARPTGSVPACLELRASRMGVGPTPGGARPDH